MQLLPAWIQPCWMSESPPPVCLPLQSNTESPGIKKKGYSCSLGSYACQDGPSLFTPSLCICPLFYNSGHGTGSALKPFPAEAFQPYSRLLKHCPSQVSTSLRHPHHLFPNLNVCLVLSSIPLPAFCGFPITVLMPAPMPCST